MSSEVIGKQSVESVESVLKMQMEWGVWATKHG